MGTPHAENAFGDVEVTIQLDPTEASTGTLRTVSIPPDNRAITIRIPPGVGDGTRLRVPGIGPATEDGTPGAVMVTVSVQAPAGTPGPPPLSPPFPPPGGASPYATQDFPTPYPPPGYPTSGIPTSGYPTSGYPPQGTPPQGFAPPGYPAQPPYGFGYPPPERPGGRRKPWLIAGALVIVLAAVIVVPRLVGGEDPVRSVSGSGGSTTTAPTEATTPVVTTAPPVTATEYQQALVVVDQALKPGIQKFGSARTPAAVEQAASQVRQTILAETRKLRAIVAPTAAESGHTLLLGSLETMANDLLQIESAAGSQELCTGFSALNRLTRTRSADQVRAAARALSTAEPTSPYRIGTFLPPSSKDASRRLNNGTYIKNGSRTGLGQLKIDNGNAQDASVSIVPANSKTAAMVVFVRAKNKFTVKGLRDGTYRIYLTTGTDWDNRNKAFTTKCTFEQFDDTMKFNTTSTTYSIWSITLNPVTGGQASTSDVDPGAFPVN